MLNQEHLKTKMIEDCQMREKILHHQFRDSHKHFRNAESSLKQKYQEETSNESDLNMALLNYLNNNNSTNSETLNAFSATDVINHLLKFDTT